MDPLMGAAAISGLASLGGGFMTATGAAAANAANIEAQRVANEQQLAAYMAQHQQNTAFMEDAQAHQIFSQNMAQEFSGTEAEKARAFNAEQAAIGRTWSEAQADKMMQFQERMASTAYQRAMADMKKAGLNPILAYQQGGASSPSGGMASSGIASGPAASGSGGSAGMATQGGSPGVRGAHSINTNSELGRAIGAAVSSAIDAMKVSQGISLMKEQEENVKQDTIKKSHEAAKTDVETQNRVVENAILKSQARTAHHVSKITEREEQDTNRYGSKATPDWLERLLRTLQGAVESRVGVP